MIYITTVIICESTMEIAGLYETFEKQGETTR